MAENSIQFLQGSEAIVKGAICAGVRFYAGYPITPSTEIAELMSVELPKLGGTFIQMEDEISSIAAIMGASVAGCKAMTATSGPGYSLMQENLGFGAMAEIPCLVVNVQRGGPSTGLPTFPAQGEMMQVRWGSHGDRPVLVLYPSSVYECFDLTIKAVNFSESYRLPVTLLLDEVIAHMREKVSLPPEDKIEVREREKPATPPEWYKPYEDTSTGVPPMANFGEGYRYHITGLTHDVMGFPTSRPDEAGPLLARLKRKITSAVRQVTLYEEFHMEDAEIAIIAYGCVARTAKDAVLRARAKGHKAGLFKPLTVWPFPKLQINEFSKRVKSILVPELNQGQMTYEVERVCAGRCKVVRLQKYNGQIFTPKEILDKIEEMA